MPLIDAYIKCDNIEGGYKAPPKKGQAVHSELHDGWSEIYSFHYEINASERASISITKPVDAASNNLYLNYLKNRSREMQKGHTANALFINQVSIDLCRWVDNNNDGIIDEFIVFIKYRFKNCRVLSYGTDIDLAAEDIPEEQITIGFREMSMEYFRPNDSTRFSWDFIAAKKA